MPRTTASATSSHRTVHGPDANSRTAVSITCGGDQPAVGAQGELFQSLGSRGVMEQIRRASDRSQTSRVDESPQDCEPPAIGAEIGLTHGLGTSAEGRGDRQPGGIPELDGPILAQRGDPPADRAESDTPDRRR